MKDKIILIVFASLLLAVVPTVFLQQESPKEIVQADGKVKIDFYAESLCPDCLQFIKTSLKTAANTKDFWKICELNIYPYGNAKYTPNGTQWAFTCQHGPKECEGNVIEACVIAKYDFYTQSLPFFICLEEGSSGSFSTVGPKCAASYKIDWNVISTCAYGVEGNNLMHYTAVATDNLVPKHTYVPWIVVNGQHTTSSENGVLLNMVRYVCSIYTGPEKIAACP